MENQYQFKQGTACLDGSFNGQCRQGNCVLSNPTSTKPSSPPSIANRSFVPTSVESFETTCPLTCGPAVRFRHFESPAPCPQQSCTDKMTTTSVELALQCSAVYTRYSSKRYADDGVQCKLTGQHYCLKGRFKLKVDPLRKFMLKMG